MHIPRPRWHDQRHFLIDLAVTDLEGCGEVLPTLVAFCGEQPLFLATLRPFEPGAHLDAIVEVGALAVGLGADRLALSLSGRAWSQADPIPPVLGPDCDLRQRVIVVHAADATTDDPMCTSTVVPFDVEPDGAVVRGEGIADQAGEGWVPRTLVVMASAGPSPDETDLARQLVRCEQLGHQLAWSQDLVARVERLRLLSVCGR